MRRHRRNRQSANNLTYNFILLVVVLSAFLHFLYTLPGAEPEKPYYEVLLADEGWLDSE